MADPAPRPEALLCAYYPQQLLPGLAAILTLRQHFGQPAHAPVTVFVWSDPGVGEHFLIQRRQAFDRLLEPFPWAHLVFPGPEEIKAHYSPNFRVRAKARSLRAQFGPEAFGAVHYAHDMGSDYMAQSAMQAFPNAVRACFGDALGVVYSNDYYTGLTYPVGDLAAWAKSPRTNLINLLWRIKRAYTLPARSRRLDAQFAVPILPCDPAGDFLPGKTLLPVRRGTLDQVLDGLAQGAGALPPETLADRHLMLLGSFCESGFATEADECAMYVQAAKDNVPQGQTLLLKAHPASYGHKVRAVAQALSAHCPIELTDSDPMPIEALRHFAHCRSVISFSYASVSLHYLYGSKVVHAMTDAFIDRYFPPRIRPWMRESNDLYLEQFNQAARARARQLGATTGGDS